MTTRTLRVNDRRAPVRIEELQFVCEEAAKDLVSKRERPFNPAIVLPQPEKTRIVELSYFPPDPDAQRELLANFADDHLVKEQIPCYGFLAEAEVDGADVMLVVYGARQHHPMLTAAAITEDGLSTEFFEPEELDPQAMPFLHPLQRAVDQIEVEPATPGPYDGSQLPIVSQ